MNINITQTIASGRPVYIMPFNIVGITSHHILARQGLRITGFCDNNSALDGKEYNGIPVMSPEKAYTANSGALIVVASVTHAKAITHQLYEIGFKDIINSTFVLELDTEFEALSDVDFTSALALVPAQKNQFNLATMYLMEAVLPAHARGADAVVIPLLDICTTQRCTLKCRDCSHLMQYYRSPCDVDMAATLGSLQHIMSVVDYIRIVNILGGEPLLHKQLSVLLLELRRYSDKIGKAVLITNGTLMPSPEVFRALKSSNITIHISDYGEHSRKRDQIISEASRYGVEAFPRVLGWKSICNIADKSTPEETEAKYGRCTAPCKQLHGRRLFNCPFLSQARGLGAIPDDSRDYVLLDDPDLSRDTIREYLNRTTAFPGCAYCNEGFSSIAIEVERAVQVKEPLPYTVVGNCTD